MWRILIMWSALAGMATDIIGGGMNSAIQYGTSKALSKYNYELGQKSLRNSPSSYKEGLERAGINPILASNSPIGSTSGSSGVNPGMDLADAGNKGSSAVQYKKATESQIKVNDAQANSLNDNAKANLMQAQAALKNAETNEKGLTLGYTNTVVNGLNNLGGGTIVPLINGQKHADAIKSTKTPPAAVVPTPNSAKAMPKTPAAAVVPTPSSSKGALEAVAETAGKVVAPAVGYALGQYGIGKWMESKGYGDKIKGPNPNELKHRTGGLGTFKKEETKYKKRRHN